MNTVKSYKPGEYMLDVVKRTRMRREFNVDNTEDWFYHEHKNTDYGGKLLRWIDSHTTGPFYLDSREIAFEKSEDAFIFGLWYKNNVLSHA